MLVEVWSTQPEIIRSINSACSCIVDFIVKEGGSTTLNRVNTYTKLIQVGDVATNYVKLLCERNPIVLYEDGNILADVKALKLILAKMKVDLPSNHNKLWGEDDVVLMCELYVNNNHLSIIAKKLYRTEGAVLRKMHIVWETGDIIPWAKKHAVIRQFIKMRKKPNPKVY